MEEKEDISLLGNSVINHETIKLAHNSRGYTWELRIFVDNKDYAKALDRIKQLDIQMMKEFGGGYNED